MQFCSFFLCFVLDDFRRLSQIRYDTMLYIPSCSFNITLGCYFCASICTIVLAASEDTLYLKNIRPYNCRLIISHFFKDH